VRNISVYLAGPEVFLPDAVMIGRRKQDLCRQRGLVGHYPLDNALDGEVPGKPISLRIFEGNIALMGKADAIVANLTPFRGPSADAGTVFEIGTFFGMGKPCFGYSNVPGTYLERAAASHGRSLRDGRVFDDEGLEIEDFGLADNLMIPHALEMLGAPLVTAPSMPRTFDGTWRDMAQFDRCLRLVAGHFRAAA